MKYEITKEQLLNIEKVGGADVSLYLKEHFAEAFKTEFEVNKWYVPDSEIGSLWYLEEISKNGMGIGYGFLRREFKHCDTIAIKDDFQWRLATPEEVESALINEAKKRGFIEGAKTQGTNNEREISTLTKGFIYNDNILKAMCTGEFFEKRNIYENGIWGTIIPQEKTLVPMEKALKIIAGEKYICRKDVVMSFDSRIEFKRGLVYYSEFDGKITNESGDNHHEVPNDFAYKHFLHLPK